MIKVQFSTGEERHADGRKDLKCVLVSDSWAAMLVIQKWGPKASNIGLNPGVDQISSKKPESFQGLKP